MIFLGIGLTLAGNLDGLGASVFVLVSGLTNGRAQIGTEATITVSASNGDPILTQSWGTTPGGSELGTGANPSSLAAFDGGTLYVNATTAEGALPERSYPIAQAAPVLVAAMVDQTFDLDSGVQVYDPSATVTGAALTWSISTLAGVSIDGGTGVVSFDTGVLGIQTGTNITITATNSGGSVFDIIALTVSGFGLDVTPSGTIVVDDAGGNLTVTVSGGTPFDGVYTQDTDANPLTVAALSLGPQWLVAPVLSGDGSPDVGETLTFATGLALFDEANGMPSVAYTTNGANAVDDVAQTLLVDAADAGQTLTITATATDAGGARAATSNGVSIPAAATLTYTITDTADNSAGTSASLSELDWTTPGLSLGAEDADRIIYVALMLVSYDATVPPVVSIGGVYAQPFVNTSQGSNVTRTLMYRAAVPTGTTGDLVVTYPDDRSDANAGWLDANAVILRGVGLTDVNSATAAISAATADISLDVTAGDEVFGFALGDNAGGSIGFTGLDDEVGGAGYIDARSDELLTWGSALAATTETPKAISVNSTSAERITGFSVALRSGVAAVAPATTLAPVIIAEGNPDPVTSGALLSVLNTGTWVNKPTSLQFEWRRDGVAIAGATSSTYTTVVADEGTTITCAVTATNAAGGAVAISNGLVVSAGVSANAITQRDGSYVLDRNNQYIEVR